MADLRFAASSAICFSWMILLAAFTSSFASARFRFSSSTFLRTCLHERARKWVNGASQGATTLARTQRLRLLAAFWRPTPA